MNKNIIITADDYGLCKSVNVAIEACLTAGAVQSTCVMMNMPAFSDLILLRKRFPGVSIGLHWTLTQGSPVLPASQIPSLIGVNGEFHPKTLFKRRWITKHIDVDELKAELGAQFQKYNEIAGVPFFWCTHQDIHVFPGLFQIFVAVGRELDIPAMRSHRRIVVSNTLSPLQYFTRHPSFWLKSKIVAQWSDWAEKLGMLMPDGQIQYRGFEASFAGFEQVLNCLQWNSAHQVMELTIHPATTTDENLFHSLKASRLLEYKVFSDSLYKDLIQSKGIRTVSYESLK